MLTVCSDRVVAFDVDDTLIYVDKPDDQLDSDKVEILFQGLSQFVWVDEEILQKINDYKLNKYFIILWSQSGNDWVNAVASSLNLTAVVDMAITKPEKCYDDLPVKEWMKRVFKDHKWTKKK